MKRYLLIIAIVFTSLRVLKAQLPNRDFEQWWVVGNASIPTDWFTYNLVATGNFFPVTKDTIHFPENMGANSIRLENKISLLPANEAKGIIVSAKQLLTLPNDKTPSFPIIGHPDKLTGYYKYIPQNGDTMWIAVILFQKGVAVAQGSFYSKTNTSNWSSFSIPISTYNTADSGEILIAAFNADKPNKLPLGNSVLNIDNLNLETSVQGVSQKQFSNQIAIYPNPTNGSFTISLPNQYAELTISNCLGQAVLKTTTTEFNTSLQLDRSGIYLLQIKTSEGSFIKRVIVN